jgi:hypothetical protein
MLLLYPVIQQIRKHDSMKRTLLLITCSATIAAIATPVCIAWLPTRPPKQLAFYIPRPIKQTAFYIPRPIKSGMNG